jgi:hypothetical protein
LLHIAQRRTAPLLPHGGSNLGCAFDHATDCGQNQRGAELPWRPHKVEEKMADHDVSARVLISVRETEVL